MSAGHSEWALQTAAQCWGDPRVSDRVMDIELAKVFAEKLDAERADAERERIRLAACSVAALWRKPKETRP